MDSPNKLLISVTENFQALADKNRATKMKLYMKNLFDFYGVDATNRKLIFKSHKESFKKLEVIDIESICYQMWDETNREWQYLALDFLDTLQKKNQEHWLELFEHFIQQKSWWDTVDGLASKQIGSYFLQYPNKRDAAIDKWLKSDHLWLQRTTLIFQLKYKDKTDLDLLHYLIGELKSKKDFFIQKAIGWSLRQVSTDHPQFVMDSVSKYDLNGIAKKEAIRKII